MERFWRATGVALGKHWKLVAARRRADHRGARRSARRKIEFATGQDSYLNPDSQVAIDNVEFQDSFGGETVILLFTADEGPGADVSDLFAGDEPRRRSSGSTTNSATIDETIAVITPLHVAQLQRRAASRAPGADALLAAAGRDPDQAGAEARNADIAIGSRPARRHPRPIADDRRPGLERPADLRQRRIHGRRRRRTGRAARRRPGDPPLAGVDVPEPADGRRRRRAEGQRHPRRAVGRHAGGARRPRDAEFEGFDLTVTGSPVYLKEINDYLKGGMLTLGVAALVVMAIVLGVMFGVRWRLLPLLAVLFGVLWSFSILGLIGIDLSLVTIAGLPILIGLGIDFAIQVHNRVEEEVVLDHEEHPIGETLANLAPPLIAATLTGVVAFLALQISKVPMIRDFGVLLAIGVAVLVVGRHRRPRDRARHPRVQAADEGARSRRASSGSSSSSGRCRRSGARRSSIAAVVLFVGGILVEGRTKIQSDPIKWIDQGSDRSSPTSIGSKTDTGFGTTLGILVEANNVYDQDVIDLIWRLHDRRRGTPRGGRRARASSTRWEDHQDRGRHRPRADDATDIVDGRGARCRPTSPTALVAPHEPPDGDQDVDAGQPAAGAGRASTNGRCSSTSCEPISSALIDELDVPADSILFTGPAPRAGAGAGGAGRARHRRHRPAREPRGEPRRAHLPRAVPGRRCTSCCAPGASPGRCWRSCRCSSPSACRRSSSAWLDSTLSPLTTVGGPLVIATCAEFCVLILGRYLEERQTGLPPREAVDTAASRTGRAFFTSACTTIGGFAVLIGSALPLLRDFGIIVTLNVAIAVLAALVVMPPMMVWVDERGLARHRGAATTTARCGSRPRCPAARRRSPWSASSRSPPAPSACTPAPTRRPAWRARSPTPRPRSDDDHHDHHDHHDDHHHAAARVRTAAVHRADRPGGRSVRVPDRGADHADRGDPVPTPPRTGRGAERRQLRDHDRLRGGRRERLDRDGYRHPRAGAGRRGHARCAQVRDLPGDRRRRDRGPALRRLNGERPDGIRPVTGLSDRRSATGTGDPIR